MATIEEQPERTLESRLRFTREMMQGSIYRKYEKAMRKYRTRLYSINKEFSGKWRFRTIREGSILMIWRLAY